MDILTFITKLAEALAWPSVAIGVLLWLRKDLPTIIRSMRKLKFKDVEMEFGAEAEALAAETAKVVPAPSHGATLLGQPEEAIASRLAALADISPRAAILESWLLVEAAAANVIRKHAPITSTPGPLRLLEGLRRAEVLTPPQELAFEHLRRLRNDAVHAPDAEFTPLAVSRYIESALAMAGYLEDVAQ